MGRWGDAVQKAGGGLFMDLQPGNNRIRVLSDPVVENKTFQSGPSTIFSWIVYDYATAQVRVLSKGSSFLRKFDFFTEAWGEDMPMKCDIVIKKTGASLNTQYEFAAVPVQEEMAADWREQMAKIDLSKLKPNSFSIVDYSVQDQAEAKADSIRDGIDASLDAAAEQEDNRPLPPKGEQDVVVDDIPDEPINLDDIPF